jgi:pimeloyl-ACP methyl ester carboxylesterase
MHPRNIRIHGHDVGYRMAGSGPSLVLIHGMASSSEAWLPVIPALAERNTVIAPDLLGHGFSSKRGGDYSLGSLATAIRDLMAALGHEHATVVGHSLGGGVAMQFAYQFPQTCERLILVGAGGLGRDVNPILRVLSVPVVDVVLGPIFRRELGAVASSGLAFLRRLGIGPAPSVDEVVSAYTSLADAETRRAFFQVLRAVIDHGGQRISAHDRLYLAASKPTLIIWGERDAILPVHHAHETHAAMPGSVLQTFPGVGHYPHQDVPDDFVECVQKFLDSTEPSLNSWAQLREMLTAPRMD